MDRDVEALRRAAARAPEDADVAARLDQALRRAGRDDEVVERYRAKLRCDLRFEDLDETPVAFTRRCRRCARDVVWTADAKALRAAVRAGRCVAAEGEALEALLRGLAASPGALDSARAPGAPCLVEGADPEPDWGGMLMGMYVPESLEPGAEGEPPT